MFSVPRLERAAEQWLKLGRKDRVLVSEGVTKAHAKFSEMAQKDWINGTIEGLKVSNSWMKISNIEGADPEYAELTRAILRDVQELSGEPIQSQVTWSQMTVFMASPHLVTPYHIDHEANFLCQITGEKDIWLFDPNDRGVLSDREIEEFYCGDGPHYRKNSEPRGQVFRLLPGVAVHHPPLAPHWVKNGPDVSISVSINFCMRATDKRARVYQVNHLLRRIGLTPAPPGRSALIDKLKANGMGLISTSHPKSYRETVFSGLDRLIGIYHLPRDLKARFSPKKRQKA